MIHLEMSTLIYQPLAQVFDFVSMPENDFQWQYGTLATARLSGSLIKPGAFFRSVGHVLGRRNVAVFEMTAYELNKTIEFKSVSGPLHVWSTYAFAATVSGTRITISTRAHVVNFVYLDEAVLEYKIKKQWKEDLRTLKYLLEDAVFRFEASPLTGEMSVC
jgi:hypothetical protein